MNRYQEALLNIRYYYAQSQKYKKLQKYNATRQLETLQELVDRVTPKKPDVNINNGYCPNCHQAFGLERTRQAMLRPYWLSYCPCCGQAIDWSEE
nr:MAG TPA: Transcription initiation factor IIE, alpha FINGER, Transcription [Caudoviricetes sp.]